MPTPYDNHDPGFTREERRIAAQYGVDLSGRHRPKCASCFDYFGEEELNASGNCPACVELMRREEALIGGGNAVKSQSLRTGESGDTGMRTFQYWDFSEEDGSKKVVNTEEEIREYYFPYWQEKMRQSGKDNLISFENCLEDWCTTHWAREIPEKETEND